MSEQLDVQDFMTPAGIVRRGTKRQGALYEATLYEGMYTTQEVIGEILRTLDTVQAMMNDRQVAKAAHRKAWERDRAAYPVLVAAMERSKITVPPYMLDIDQTQRVYANDPPVMDALRKMLAAGDKHTKKDTTALMRAMKRSKIAVRGDLLQIERLDRIALVYAADPAVMAVVRRLEAAAEIRVHKAVLALVRARERSKTVIPGKTLSIGQIEQVYTEDPVVMAAVKEYKDAAQAFKEAEEQLAEVRARQTPEVDKRWADANGPVELIGTRHAIGTDGTTYTLGKGGLWVRDSPHDLVVRTSTYDSRRKHTTKGH